MINAKKKVMIIDDDAPIREYLLDVIDWDGLGLVFSCEAGDSETAAELFSVYRPDIVVTDVSIPVISGLELARRFTEEDSSIRVIVITGFNDFDMVRDSVALGAIDLLSKPIGPDEINESLKKACASIDDARREQQTSRLIGSMLTENKTVLRERLIAKLFQTDPSTEEMLLQEQLRLLDFSFSGLYFAAVYIKLDSDSFEEFSGAALPTAFQKLCESTFQENRFRIFTYFNDIDQLNCLVNWSFESGDEQIEYLLSKLLEETRHYFQTEFHAAIGGTVTDLRDLHVSAQQAKLSLRFDDPASPNILNYRNIGRMAARSMPVSKDVLRRISASVQTGTSEYDGLIRNALPVGETGLEALNAAREISFEVLSHLSKMCYSTGIYPWNTVNYAGTMAEIFGASSAAVIADCLCESCRKLSEALATEHFRSKNQLIASAKQFINDNLSDHDLSLDSVASHVGLSKIYFCQLFHKEEGTSFNNYLNQERIEYAKRLLRGTTQKIFEISDLVGYSNPKYFNYVFKKVTGSTPLDYRRGV